MQMQVYDLLYRYVLLSFHCTYQYPRSLWGPLQTLENRVRNSYRREMLFYVFFYIKNHAYFQ
jgi:hypothetical protein